MAPQTPTSPYIQQLYAASANPYGQVSPNIMQLMQGGTGNPLLDMYTGQYCQTMGSMAAAAYPHPGTTALSAFGIDLYYKTHATSLTTTAFP